MAKEINILSSTITNLDKTKTAKDYIGKKIFSKTGALIGKIEDIVLKDEQFKGFIVKKYFVDKEYLNSESKDAIILSIDPIIALIGKQVIDSEGRKLGKVVDINRKTNSNNFAHLLVKKNIISKAIIIHKEDIEVSKESILLNKSFDTK